MNLIKKCQFLPLSTAFVPDFRNKSPIRIHEAELMERVATENGLRVLHYAKEIDETREMMVTMKKNNVRVIAAIMGHIPMCLQSPPITPGLCQNIIIE